MKDSIASFKKGKCYIEGKDWSETPVSPSSSVNIGGVHDMIWSDRPIALK